MSARSGRPSSACSKAGVAHRDEIIIATKGGYLPFNQDLPPDRDRYLRETFINTRLSAKDIIDGHCLAPQFLRAMIEQSLRNLGVSCIDVYYLHNPESQLRTPSAAPSSTNG